jgi:hypothetical protein
MNLYVGTGEIGSCFLLSPFEPGERVKENPGEQRRLSERSETERVQPRPGFFERANAHEGRVHRGALSFVLSLGKQRKDHTI